MAALNFPSSPVTNQIYTANGKSWRWDGTAWKSFNTIGITGGGTGLTSIITGNAFLSSDAAGAGLTYRTFTAGSGMQITVSANDVTFAATGVTSGTVTGTGSNGAITGISVDNQASNYGYNLNSTVLTIQPATGFGSGGTVNATMLYKNLVDGSGYYTDQIVSLQ